MGVRDESPARRWGITTVFLDRDGTINVKAPDGEYVTTTTEFRFLPDAREAVRALSDAGLRVIVVTNQRGVARGRMTEADLEAIHLRMLDELERAGARVDAVYHCPHDDGECDCRKPASGMLERAREDIGGIDFGRSVVIGDSESDMQAGRAVGCHLIKVGGAPGEPVDRVEPSLASAVKWLTGAG